uniref:(northern house mosquito) hypothetical protein n=1 Tax=Culex pipiens TaxID=7175 RepID=A0A8D8FFK3_CULPI
MPVSYALIAGRPKVVTAASLHPVILDSDTAEPLLCGSVIATAAAIAATDARIAAVLCSTSPVLGSLRNGYGHRRRFVRTSGNWSGLTWPLAGHSARGRRFLLLHHDRRGRQLCCNRYASLAQNVAKLRRSSFNFAAVDLVLTF